jgi:hypothetical protein
MSDFINLDAELSDAIQKCGARIRISRTMEFGEPVVSIEIEGAAGGSLVSGQVLVKAGGSLSAGLHAAAMRLLAAHYKALGRDAEGS